MMEMSSKVLAKMALSIPARENTAEVSSMTRMASPQSCTARSVNSRVTAVTARPTARPRAMPPAMKPRMRLKLLIGATISSSMWRCILALKKEDTTLA
jgi:hypothetical protein